MSEPEEKEEIKEFDLTPEEEVGTEPEETERHRGESVVRKKFPHQYTIQLSGKENETVKDLQQKFEADSVKELLLKLGEVLAKDKNHPHLYAVNVSTEGKKLIEKVIKEYGVEDATELLLALSLIAEDEECPKCGYPLQLVSLCLNCAECYQFDEEDLNEKFEQLKHGEEPEETEEE